ncbi:MAG TPA: glycosyltransferase family 2 protein [Clostridiales bacterium]|nr:glycosyltransferase family 2 protein [Clostridiales bacterium]
MTGGKIVSVIVPVYNESKYINGLIGSLLKQDFPRENSEWLFIDGNSSDGTKEILGTYEKEYPELIRVFDNPRRIAPCAMNIGIENSCGRYIVRLDAHSEYAENYISLCVDYLEKNPEISNVGGVAETKAKGFTGGAIAKMLSSKFGVGNSAFRTNAKSGYVDTVPFGAFRREIFERLGGFDERLARDEDNEINYRIRKNGGKVYLADDIRLTYYCRDTVRGIASMAVKNGTWNVIAMKLCPGSMGIRHFVPLCFVLSLAALSVAGIFFRPLWFVLAAEAALYILCDFFFSAKSAKSVREFFALIFLFPVFHISYGIGSLGGIFRLFSKKFRKPRKEKTVNGKGN